VELNPNGFGAATLGDISGNPKLKAVGINGVAPNATSIGNGSYLLYTPVYLVTNPRSPKAVQVQAFIDFLQTDAAKAAMRLHAVLPYQDGIALASKEDSRSDQIFTELGVHPGRLIPTATPVAATVAATEPAASSPAASESHVASKSSADDTGGATYTVVKGDTLSLIAQKHTVTVAQLREWNHLKGDQIKLGQVLHVSDH